MTIACEDYCGGWACFCCSLLMLLGSERSRDKKDTRNGWIDVCAGRNNYYSLILKKETLIGWESFFLDVCVALNWFRDLAFGIFAKAKVQPGRFQR